MKKIKERRRCALFLTGADSIDFNEHVRRNPTSIVREITLSSGDVRNFTEINGKGKIQYLDGHRLFF